MLFAPPTRSHLRRITRRIVSIPLFLTSIPSKRRVQASSCKDDQRYTNLLSGYINYFRHELFTPLASFDVYVKDKYDLDVKNRENHESWAMSK